MKKVKVDAYSIFLIIVLVAIGAKVVQFNFLPPKFFYDSNAILMLMEGRPTFRIGDSYQLAALFSNWINIFKLQGLFQWSVFYAVIFNLVTFFVLIKFNLQGAIAYFWIFASFALLNIYTFNLSKESLQFVVFFIIYFILKLKFSTSKKLILSLTVLFAWGVIFRIYYILIAGYSILSYFALRYACKKTSFVWFFVVFIFGIFLSLAFAYLFMPDEYNRIIYIHAYNNLRREGSEDALTMINDVIHNEGNLLLYMLNYFINLMRMMFPIEIAIRGNIRYMLFFVYQFTTTLFFIRSIRYLKVISLQKLDEKMLALCVYAGFLAGSALFEPDFGSWVRHESAATLIMLLAFFDLKLYAQKKHHAIIDTSLL